MLEYLRALHKFAFDREAKMLFGGMALASINAVVIGHAEVLPVAVYFIGVLISWPPAAWLMVTVMHNVRRYRNRGFKRWIYTRNGKRFVLDMPACVSKLPIEEHVDVANDQLRGQ